jgi:hypothetical protein
MAKIISLSGAKEYVLTQLGSPVVCVEIADIQLESVIEDSIQILNKYHQGVGNYEDYIGFTLSAGVQDYALSGMEAVVDVSFNSNLDGINVLFSPTHQLLHRDWVIHGNYPGGANGPGSGMALTHYRVLQMYLKDVEREFMQMFKARYSREREEVKIIPTPTQDGTALFKVFRRETAENLYNNDLFKRLAVAKAKIIWANNVGKYTMTLPGGGTINYADIRAEGKEELEKVLSDIQLESETPVFMVG